MSSSLILMLSSARPSMSVATCAMMVWAPVPMSDLAHASSVCPLAETIMPTVIGAWNASQRPVAIPHPTKSPPSSIARGAELAGRALAALERMVVDQGLLQRMEHAILRQPFDCGDACAVLHDGQLYRNVIDDQRCRHLIRAARPDFSDDWRRAHCSRHDCLGLHPEFPEPGHQRFC
jgi:hypothetical protein